MIEELLLTLGMAFFFGLERQYSHKPIGFGTFIFVAVGACGLTIAAASLSENPLPLLSGIVTGIGFLGAGALIKTTDKIFGFMTAASIWLFAIVGVVIGLEEYRLGISIYAIVWLVVLIDRFLARRGIGSYQKKITIRTNKLVNVREITSALGMEKHKLVSVDINKKDKKMTLQILVTGKRAEINKVSEHLLGKEWFDSVMIE